MTDEMLALEWEMLQTTILSRAQELGPHYAEAVWAAAVPHWFDEELLAALLSPSPQPSPQEGEGVIPPLPARERGGGEGVFAWLIARPFVERCHQPVPEGAPHRYALHERTRRALLAHLQSDEPDRFRALSERAKEYYERNLVSEAHLEMIYHWLAVDDERAFKQWQGAYHAAENSWQLSACAALLALAQEQRASLTGDRLLWLQYYQGRWLRYAQRWAEALAILESLSKQELSTQLRPMLTNTLGMVYNSLGRWTEALAQYKQSLTSFRELSDRQGEGATLNNIGLLYESQGRWAEALAQYEASLTIFRKLGNRLGEGATLNNVGRIYQSQGRWAKALACFTQALTICRELSSRQGENITLGNIGELHIKQGNWEQAYPLLNQALQTAQELGNKEIQADSLQALGEWHQEQGQWDEAIARYEQALALHRELGAKADIGAALDALGEIYRDRGMWAQAVQVHERALEIWRELAHCPSPLRLRSGQA